MGNLPGDVREREIEDLFYKVCLMRRMLLLEHEDDCLLPATMLPMLCVDMCPDPG